MDRAGYGAVMACDMPAEPMPVAPGSSHSPELRPARTRMSSFGDDQDLANELPPNWDLRRFQDKAKSVLNEYFVSLAVEDTVASAVELLALCPSEADELGVVAMKAALDRGKDAPSDIVRLFEGLSRSASFDRPALVRSFEKIFCRLEDLKIDAPMAEKGILEILQGCIATGCVDKKLLSKLPETLLRGGLAGDKVPVSPEFHEMLEKTVQELKSFKHAAGRCIEDRCPLSPQPCEYFVTMNAEEVGTVLKELSMAPYHHEFVKKAPGADRRALKADHTGLEPRPFHREAITMSFSQTSESAGREAVLQLLNWLCTDGVLSKMQRSPCPVQNRRQLSQPLRTTSSADLRPCPELTEMSSAGSVDPCREEVVLQGSEASWAPEPALDASGQVDDLSLDYPRCIEMLTEVIIRLLVDELVSVPFLRRCRTGLSRDMNEIKAMILEYFNSGDTAEARWAGAEELVSVSQ
ncbi:EIF4G1 [Symbiodinium sp. CCMP2592]|nr:EIF4G1 [Symbiodinium sp. CCMP2592]